MIQLNFGLVVLTLSIVLHFEWQLCHSVSQWPMNDDDVHNISDINITKFYEDLFYILKSGDINDINKTNQSQSRIKRIVFPGASWCGIGQTTVDKDEIGHFYDTDKCCRAHELCLRDKFKPKTQTKILNQLINDNSTSPTIMDSIIPTESSSTQPVTLARLKPGQRPQTPPPEASIELDPLSDSYYDPTPSPERQRARPMYFEPVYEPQTIPPPFGYVPRKNLERKSRELSRMRRSGKPSKKPERWSMKSSDCGCDRTFYKCLEEADNPTSRKVGKLYFNILHRYCQTFDHPIRRCITRQGIFGWRCIEYQVDTTKPMMLQMRDNPYFYYLL